MASIIIPNMFTKMTYVDFELYKVSIGLIQDDLSRLESNST